MSVKPRLITRHRGLLIGLLLVAASLAAYGQVRHHGFTNFDDNQYVWQNRYVQHGFSLESLAWAFTALHADNWHPLTWLSHMLDYELFGLHAGGHHVSSLLLHLANMLLLLFVLKRMTGAFWQSAFVAALFGLHPLHVESVAWVSERKDVLSALFWMLTLWCYLRFVERRTLSRYLLTVGCFALGLMSKPMMVTLPFVLLLLDFYPLKRFSLPAAQDHAQARTSTALGLVVEKTPLFVLAGLSCATTFYAQKQAAVVFLAEIPFKARIANALVSYASYILKMFWPSPLAVPYPYRWSLPWWHVAAAGALLAVISLLAARLAEQRPYLAVGWLWYLGTLVPVIGLVQVGEQSMADRYTYLPLIGLFMIIAWGVPELLARWRHRNLCLAIAASLCVLALIPVTWRQAGYWKNTFTLFEHTLEVTSANFLPHYNLGLAYYEQGRTATAVEHYRQALRINPRSDRAHNNLGLALQQQGRLAEAAAHYRQALQINPDSDQALINLGLVLHQQGLVNDALEHYRQALRVNPQSDQAHYNLGLALGQQGQTEAAIGHYLEALKINPNFAEAHNNLGNAFFRTGNITAAIDHFRAAIQIRPGYVTARSNLDAVLKLQARHP